MTSIDSLRAKDFEDLITQAWEVRANNFSSVLTVSAPSPKTYITDHYRNKRNSFVNISITGTTCALNCDHCKRKLLDSMIPAMTPEKLQELGDGLVEKGCEGVLISGGASVNGGVSFDGFYDAIRHLKSKGLKVIAHTGLVESENVATNLKNAGVDQVLIDVIGDTETIQEVYHLKKTPDDFERSLKILNNAGLSLAPHIVIGLNYGKIKGEYHSIKLITEINPDVIVLVVLSPIHDTPMFGTEPPSPSEIARVAAVTRIINPNTPITLGCVRPAGIDKMETERLMIRAGVNGITYPLDETIDFAESLGLKLEYKETCCSLLSI